MDKKCLATPAGKALDDYMFDQFDTFFFKLTLVGITSTSPYEHHKLLSKHYLCLTTDDAFLDCKYGYIY